MFLRRERFWNRKLSQSSHSRRFVKDSSIQNTIREGGHLPALSVSSCVAEDVTKLRVRGEWQVLTVTVGEEAEDMTESGIYCKFEKGGAFSVREGESAYQNVATWGIEGTVLTLRYFDRPAETWNIF